MPETKNKKPYDLEKRTLQFAKEVIGLCKKLPKEVINAKLVDQVVRAAGSVGANYREANEAISKKDFLHRLRIARQEAKECSYWLELIKDANREHLDAAEELFAESIELRKILNSIIEKSS
jgi:four helix bundle protein